MIDLAILSTICFAASLSPADRSCVTPVSAVDALPRVTVPSQPVTGDSVSRAVTFRSADRDIFVTDNLRDSLVGGSQVNTPRDSVKNGASLEIQPGVQFQFSEFDPMGAVRDAGNLFHYQSHSRMTADPFMGRQTMTPEPGSIVMTLMGAGMIAFAGLLRRRQRRRRGREL